MSDEIKSKTQWRALYKKRALHTDTAGREARGGEAVPAVLSARTPRRGGDSGGGFAKSTALDRPACTALPGAPSGRQAILRMYALNTKASECMKGPPAGLRGKRQIHGCGGAFTIFPSITDRTMHKKSVLTWKDWALLSTTSTDNYRTWQSTKVDYTLSLK